MEQSFGKDSRPWLALIGNPNSGKTAIFNLLTGLHQKVSNYPGVTVEQKRGNAKLDNDLSIDLIDLPGTYSLTPESLDERIVAEQVLKWIHGGDRPAAIISVVDASNLSRNCYLTSQLLDLDIPVIIALNMMDLVKKNNHTINVKTLQEQLGVSAVIPMSALEKKGIQQLKNAISNAVKKGEESIPTQLLTKDTKIREYLQPIKELFSKEFGYSDRLAWAQSLRVITRQSAMNLYENPKETTLQFDPGFIKKLRLARKNAIAELEESGFPHRTLEATLRYHWLDDLLISSKIITAKKISKITRSEKTDRILTHRFFGPVIFVGILMFIFQSIFSWATLPMNIIERGVGFVGEFLMNSMAPGMFKGLLVEGIIAGVGAILVFLPQILILVALMSIMEDLGYMSRVAFMMDKFMTRIGLHGRSVLPLMSGYACAIPGIMATRTIDSWKERLITILIVPLMSCSARLPVYVLMIGTFIPANKVFGIFSLQGLTLVFMYFLGTGAAFIIARIFSRIIRSESKSTFVMELPPYRIPMPRSIFHQVYLRGKQFVLNAGKIIMAVSIVLWFMASFPKTTDEATDVNPIHNSFAGKIGHTIEPIIKPLGFDWKLGVGLITSFAAREVIVSTLATLYNVEEGIENVVSLSEALQNDRDPITGEPVYSTLVALSLMVFFVFAAQCMATFAIVKNETNSWKWPLIMIVYMTGLAYLGSLIVFQGGSLLGFGT
jgi:ferrous iron transport protein B